MFNLVSFSNHWLHFFLIFNQYGPISIPFPLDCCFIYLCLLYFSTGLSPIFLCSPLIFIVYGISHYFTFCINVWGGSLIFGIHIQVWFFLPIVFFFNVRHWNLINFFSTHVVSVVIFTLAAYAATLWEFLILSSTSSDPGSFFPYLYLLLVDMLLTLYMVSPIIQLILCILIVLNNTNQRVPCFF